MEKILNNLDNNLSDDDITLIDQQNSSEDGNIVQLLKENLETNNEILKAVKYIKKYIFFQRIMFFVKILLILIPIILAFAFLPILRSISAPLESLLSVYKGIEAGNIDFIESIGQ